MSFLHVGAATGAVVTKSRVENAERAGLVTFGNGVQMDGNELACNALDLVAEERRDAAGHFDTPLPLL